MSLDFSSDYPRTRCLELVSNVTVPKVGLLSTGHPSTENILIVKFSQLLLKKFINTDVWKMFHPMFQSVESLRNVTLHKNSNNNKVISLIWIPPYVDVRVLYLYLLSEKWCRIQTLYSKRNQTRGLNTEYILTCTLPYFTSDFGGTVNWQRKVDVSRPLCGKRMESRGGSVRGLRSLTLPCLSSNTQMRIVCKSYSSFLTKSATITTLFEITPLSLTQINQKVRYFHNRNHVLLVWWLSTVNV